MGKRKKGGFFFRATSSLGNEEDGEDDDDDEEEHEENTCSAFTVQLLQTLLGMKGWGTQEQERWRRVRASCGYILFFIVQLTPYSPFLVMRFRPLLRAYIIYV